MSNPSKEMKKAYKDFTKKLDDAAMAMLEKAFSDGFKAGRQSEASFEKIWETSIALDKRDETWLKRIKKWLKEKDFKKAMKEDGFSL